MHFVLFACALVATVAAAPSAPSTQLSPVRGARGQTVSRAPFSLPNATLSACEAASNCETYQDPVLGTRIRFVEGMGPGSDYDRLRRRDDALSTTVYVADGVLNYGSAGASGDGGVLHHLYDACSDSVCDKTPFTVSSDFCDATAPYTSDLVVYADGQYENQAARDIYIGAILEVASKGEFCWTQTWSHGTYGGAAESGEVGMCKQSNFINVHTFGADGSLHGFMNVRVELADTESNWCATMLDVLGDIAGILAAVPGLEAVGGAGAFFGIASLDCE